MRGKLAVLPPGGRRVTNLRRSLVNQAPKLLVQWAAVTAAIVLLAGVANRDDRDFRRASLREQFERVAERQIQAELGQGVPYERAVGRVIPTFIKRASTAPTRAGSTRS